MVPLVIKSIGEIPPLLPGINSRYVGDVSKFTLDGIVIDNYYFGVASVGRKWI